MYILIQIKEHTNYILVPGSDFFHFYFLNVIIAVTMQDFELKLTMHNPESGLTLVGRQ